MPNNLLKGKAQGRMLEVILAVVFFTALILFAMLFLSKKQQELSSQQLNDMRELQAAALAQVILNMPEIRCDVQNCIDIYKFLVFKQKEKNIFYSTAFGAYSSRAYNYEIKLSLIYPEVGTFIITNGKGKSSTLFEFPVTAYNATSEQYSFGMLSVRVYI
ncbi:MAG: hypothetical protein QXT20_03040 [Candidatus Woesearchaeota archaeon]